MWTSIEPWQVAQLQRMATLDPERVEHALNVAYYSDPTLLNDLTISAVDQEELSVDQAACTLGMSAEQVEERLIEFRNRTPHQDEAVTIDDTAGIARLTKGRIAVWEVIRLHRKFGCVEEVMRAYPLLSRSELNAALRYAESNADEIEDQIRRYEDMINRRLVEYPFVK